MRMRAIEGMVGAFSKGESERPSKQGLEQDGWVFLIARGTAI